VHDDNAIEVHMGGTQLGWVARDQAAPLHNKLKTHMKLFDTNVVHARIVKTRYMASTNVWAEAEVCVSWLKTEWKAILAKHISESATGRVGVKNVCADDEIDEAMRDVSDMFAHATKKLGDNPKYKINRLAQVVSFGRHRDTKFANITDLSYVNWMLKQRMISIGLFEAWCRVHGVHPGHEGDKPKWDEDDEEDVIGHQRDCDDA
jgi:hypothetical protein